MYEQNNSPKFKRYLGLDFSTQQLKAIVISEDGAILQEAFVGFDSELPEFRTHGGVNSSDDGRTVTASPIMWVKALDMLMDKLRVAGTDFSCITAISGAAQQHGGVFWKTGAESALSSLVPERFLHHQLSLSFSIMESPVWMDSSTTLYCRKLEEAVGGPLELAKLTGSRGFERFTGNQIAKIANEKKGVISNTERISLVSSFVCSIFLGKYAAIDYSDGSGMNLLNVKTKNWEEKCLDECCSGLKNLLGPPCPSNSVLGKVSNYFVERYDMNPECDIVAFTGDNPSSIAGMLLKKGDVAVSLGTSDTLFLWISEPKVTTNGHIFVNPLAEDEYMAILCYKNGSMAREVVRNDYADGCWDIFSELLDMTPRGNFGNIAMFYFLPEIFPPVEGCFRFNKAGVEVKRFSSNEVEVRALIEGQFLAKRVHAQNLGLDLNDVKRVLVTGGASRNNSILQVLADVFNCPVFAAKNTVNSASLGAAYRALSSVSASPSSWPPEGSFKGVQYELICSPNSDAKDIYDAMTERFLELEQNICSA